MKRQREREREDADRKRMEEERRRMESSKQAGGYATLRDKERLKNVQLNLSPILVVFNL